MNSLLSYLLALVVILCFFETVDAQWGGWGYRRRMMGYGGYPYGGYGMGGYGMGGYGMGGYGMYGMYGK